MLRMSYVVLARKYRPRRFSEMVGQDAVVAALTNALERQRLHHAYLFTGTRGIGKTTVSRILAKSLNCTGADGTGGITSTPCGVCTACTEIDADRYIDYIELDAASNRGIDEIRDLLERAQYKPSVGRFKIFMIDEAHQLTKDSFNALLKTLEEPPEYLKFVLATTDPEKMLPTVLSRCLQFNLRPMASETVAEHLVKVLAAEGVASDDASVRLLSRAARGSMRDALSLADQAIAFGGGALSAAGVRTMLGSVDRGHAQAFVRALAARDGKAVLAGVDALREHGLSAAGALEELAALLQQMAIEQAVPGALPDGDPDAEGVRELAALLPADETQLLYTFALHGRQELPLAPDAYAGLAMVLLRLLAFAPVAAAAGGGGPPKPATPTQGSTPTRSPAAAPVRAAPSAPSEEAGFEPTPLGDRWVCLVALLNEKQAIGALVRELAMQAQLVEQTDGAAPLWRLRVERESLRSAAQVDKLRAAVIDATGIDTLRLEVEGGIVTDSPARREAIERDRRQREAEAIILADPLVQEMLSQFSTARIVPGSIKPH
jgi:DNA polymerase-3 subunit gamma/tau